MRIVSVAAAAAAGVMLYVALPAAADDKVIFENERVRVGAVSIMDFQARAKRTLDLRIDFLFDFFRTGMIVHRLVPLVEVARPIHQT